MDEVEAGALDAINELRKLRPKVARERKALRIRGKTAGLFQESDESWAEYRIRFRQMPAEHRHVVTRWELLRELTMQIDSSLSLLLAGEGDVGAARSLASRVSESLALDLPGGLPAQEPPKPAPKSGRRLKT